MYTILITCANLFVEVRKQVSIIYKQISKLFSLYLYI